MIHVAPCFIPYHHLTIHLSNMSEDPVAHFLRSPSMDSLLSELPDWPDLGLDMPSDLSAQDFVATELGVSLWNPVRNLESPTIEDTPNVLKRSRASKLLLGPQVTELNKGGVQHKRKWSPQQRRQNKRTPSKTTPLCAESDSDYECDHHVIVESPRRRSPRAKKKLLLPDFEYQSDEYAAPLNSRRAVGIDKAETSDHRRKPRPWTRLPVPRTPCIKVG